MKVFENTNVERIERFLDDVAYMFKCDNCGREIMIPDFTMKETCECGTKWKVEVITLATGELKE